MLVLTDVWKMCIEKFDAEFFFFGQIYSVFNLVQGVSSFIAIAN